MDPKGNAGAPARRPLGIGIAASLAMAATALAAAAGPDLWRFFSDSAVMQDWIGSQGAAAPFAIAGLVAAQIAIAVLPGEPVELAAGYMLGFWNGTAACLAGGLVGTLLVVAFVRSLGMKAVRVFFTQDQIDSVSWLRDSKRFEVAMFVIFLIPGTPKDVLTYVAGLTKSPWWRIALIATVGRIPSIVTSTLAASYAAKGDWNATAIVAGVTIAVAAVGAAGYAAVSRRRRKESRPATQAGVDGGRQGARKTFSPLLRKIGIDCKN